MIQRMNRCRVQAEAITRKAEIKSSVYFPNFLMLEILLIKYILKFDVRRGKLLGMVVLACGSGTGRVEAENTF